MSTADNPRNYPLTNENEGNPNSALNIAVKAISQDVDSLVALFVKVKSEAQDTATAALENIDDLEFPAAANETWQFDAELRTACDGTGGIKVAVSVPPGATLGATTIGIGGSPGSGGRGQLEASNDLSIAYNTYPGSDGDVRIVGVVSNGATAGTVKIRFQVVTVGQTGIIRAFSTLVANRST